MHVLHVGFQILRLFARLEADSADKWKLSGVLSMMDLEGNGERVY